MSSKSAYKPAEIRSINSWANRSMRMSQKRMTLIGIFGLIALLLGMFCRVAISEGATLPDSLELRALQLQAAGRVVAADSLRKVFTAQIVLAERQKAIQDSLTALQKAAQLELYRRHLDAKVKLWSSWDAKVTPLPIDSVWVWAGCDFDKLNWLAARYHIQYDIKSSLNDNATRMANEMKARKQLRTEVSRQLRTQLTGLTSQVNKLEQRVDACEQNIAAIRKAVVKNGFDIGAALSVLEQTAGVACVNAARGKARQDK
ncbi:MAG: hypothetical protein C3F02_01115 [Parcubacteria group bacterium]|nr:MAG: hypothetical protein C3F02_01115 [Parcubacteria group bacterium]